MTATQQQQQPRAYCRQFISLKYVTCFVLRGEEIQIFHILSEYSFQAGLPFFIILLIELYDLINSTCMYWSKKLNFSVCIALFANILTFLPPLVYIRLKNNLVLLFCALNSFYLNFLFAPVTVQLEEFCEAYETYCSGVRDSIRLLVELKRNATFTQFLKSSESSSLTLSSFIKKPIEVLKSATAIQLMMFTLSCNLRQIIQNLVV